jgi:hypothetical protein
MHFFLHSSQQVRLGDALSLGASGSDICGEGFLTQGESKLCSQLTGVAASRAATRWLMKQPAVGYSRVHVAHALRDWVDVFSFALGRNGVAQARIARKRYRTRPAVHCGLLHLAVDARVVARAVEPDTPAAGASSLCFQLPRGVKRRLRLVTSLAFLNFVLVVLHSYTFMSRRVFSISKRIMAVTFLV